MLAAPLPAKLAARLLREPWIADAIFVGALVAAEQILQAARYSRGFA